MSGVGLGAPISAGSSLPPVNDALEPAWIRNGTPTIKKAYALAQGFEEMLLQELSRSMTATSGMGGEEEPSGAAGSGEAGEAPTGGNPMAGELSSLLPQALSQGVLSGGGSGLAAQLTRELQPPSHPGVVAPSGGTKA